MNAVKQKLLEELIEKLSGLDDPLMSDGEMMGKPKAKVSVMKIEAKPEAEGSDLEEAAETPDEESEESALKEMLKKKKLGA